MILKTTDGKKWVCWFGVTFWGGNCEKFPILGKTVFFYQDNPPGFRLTKTMAEIYELHLELLPLSPYSPDLNVRRPQKKKCSEERILDRMKK